MSKNKYSKSFEIALSAISCAVAVAFLWLGIFSGYLTALGYLIGILAVMTPLSKQFFKGAFLTYAGTCILTALLGALARFWDLLPFVMFFGLHPIINGLQVKYRWNTLLSYILKAAWFIGTLFAGYFMIVYGLIGGFDLLQRIAEKTGFVIYILIPIVGAAFFFIYDYLIFKCQNMVNSLVYRIKK